MHKKCINAYILSLNKNDALFSVNFKCLIFQFHFPFDTSVETRIELDFFYVSIKFQMALDPVFPHTVKNKCVNK